MFCGIDRCGKLQTNELVNYLHYTLCLVEIWRCNWFKAMASLPCLHRLLRKFACKLS